MLFTQVIAVAIFLATFASAYTVPKDAADGIYMVYIDPAGKEVHLPVNATEPLGLPKRTTMDRSSIKLNKRQSYAEFFCGCGIVMNAWDCDRAVEAFKFQLSHPGQYPNDCVRGQLSWYSIHGSVVVFICANVGCLWDTADNFGRLLADITNRCGRYVPGTYANYYNDAWFEGDRGDGGTWGYMRISENGGNFCGAAVGGVRDHC